MKRFIIVWIVLMALLSAALSTVQAADVSLFVSCIENPSESGSPRVWFGYEASATVTGVADYGPSGPSTGFGGYPPNTLEPGRHEQVFVIELVGEGVTVFYEFQADNGGAWSVTADAETEAPSCESLGAVWHPGAPSIYIPMTSDCATVDIKDTYGHWSQVTSDGEPVLLHYGEALIGGPGQSTNPADYRAVVTACF